MKKRGLISLFIVSVIAVAAVFGVIFAFKNSERQTDVYGSITVSVDKSDINLEIELIKDETSDKNFRIVETPYSSAEFTITVGGLPGTAGRLVKLNESSISSGIVTVEEVAFDQAAGATTFRVTGKDGGAPVAMTFSVMGGQTVTVNVTVNLVAKDMKLGALSHFGIRQGGPSLDLTSADILSKFVFYAHPDDDERSYTPNKFPVEYRLKQNYTGVTLEQGLLTVTDKATCVDQYIELQAKLPAMEDWIDVPFYVFPKVNKITVKTDAHKAETTAAYDNVWDLVANRTEWSSANFSFALDCEKTAYSDYGFEAESADTKMVRVNYVDQYQRSLEAAQNLGEVAINITAYPIVKINGKEIYYNDVTDANVQVKDTIYLRIRNEFYADSETEVYGPESYNLVPSKKTLDAFYYESNQGAYVSGYYDVFALDTGNGKTVNADADVEFELIVEDKYGTYTGTYGWDKTKNPVIKTSNGNTQFSLYSILQIGYWSDAIDDWVMLEGTEGKYYANYLNRFSVAFAQTGIAHPFLGANITSMILRVKGLYTLTNGDKASCDIKLDVTSAIDKFEVTNLVQFDDGAWGVALVYDTLHQTFNSKSVDVYGMYALTNADGVGYEYSQKWNTAKVSDNSEKLPFNIQCVPDVEFENNGVAGYYHMRYTISANNIDIIEYYKDYPMTVEYTNGKSYTFYIRVYPTVESLSMSVVSSSRGKIYQTLTDNYHTHYDYVRTVYVRKGFTYEFAINTPGASVGAYAVFDQISDAKGNLISNTQTNMIDARNLAEGLYECKVSLHAYSDAVYEGNETTVTVYVIVVDPVGNVTPQPMSVDLDGINDSREIILNMTSLDDKPITDDTYLYIDVAQPLNENVTVERGDAKNQFTVTAQYLTDETFTVGFKIYKRYEFPGFDLNGEGQLTPDEPFEFYYIAGAVVTVNVTINNTKPNAVNLVDGFVNSDSLGNYLELISSSGKVTNAAINLQATNNANYKDFGITFAKWKNGKFDLSAFVPTAANATLSIDEVATARLDSASGKIYVTPTEDAKSMGVYALVIYTRDSLRYVGTNAAGENLVFPDVYEIMTLYIGSESDIKSTIDELNNYNNTHDANSGKRNNLGGYNWVVAGQNDNAHAILFYTKDGHKYNSQIEANRYYLDDLYTVLGWSRLIEDTVWISKYVVENGVKRQIGEEYRQNSSNGRNYIDLDYVFDKDDNGAACSDNQTTVYFEVLAKNTYLYFYVVQCLDTFEVKINSKSGSGLVSRKNLAPNEYTNALDTVTMQRGNPFTFNTNLDINSGWKFDNHGFDSAEESSTSFVTYDGGTYSFFPYIEFDGYTFVMDVLTATVKVNVKGGVNYLNIAQDAVTLDGVTTATYDLTMRVDQSSWSPSLLTYNFLYDGVYYTLFEDDKTVSYVNMEGGKAKLEFKLTCLNPSSGVKSNFYYTYYLKIEVAVVIVAPDVDPFYDISGARLFVQENLTGSPLLNVKTPASDSAAFNLYKQGIYNVTMAHFADTSAVETNKSALTLATGQTDTGIIYLDEDSVGGILVIYPTPYYINVSSINLWTSKAHEEKVLIGTDLTGKPIYDTVKYTIGFTQMIYNETEKYYQPYLSNSNTPKMVSSWSAAEGYKWNGKYYFRTYILCDTQVTHRLADGTRFGISISIQGENNAKAIVENMTLDAKYRDSFVINPDDQTEDYAVCTMVQTQYQALGTTAVYDVTLPSGCVPNYADFSFNGVTTTSTTIESTYATVTINTVAQTLSVYLKADIAAIGASLEVRIPYRRAGDYINPYLSVVIVPVYFEFDSLEVIGHYETRLQLASRDELTKLKYRGLFDYDTSLSSSSLNEKMTTFNNSLQTSNLVSCNYETAGQVTVQIVYSYIGGVPVLTKNGTCRYARTFYYDVTETKPLVKRTEYLAVGTAATYTFYNWDSMYASKLYIADKNVDNDAKIADFWDYDIKTRDRNNVTITIDLQNKSSTVSDNAAYKALINAGKIVVKVYSTSDTITPQLELTIIPVYFTFTDFKLQNNPVKPIVALTTPTTLTVEAGGISCADDSDVTTAINTFNMELLNAQNDLSNSAALAFNRISNDDGILNFNFDPSTRAITRADSANPVTATSYLLITAGITYVNGIPTLNRTGNQISTYLPVRTFGSDAGDVGDTSIDLGTAPNGRTRKIAQAIGTTVRYNISLPGVAFDSVLDKYEIRTDGNYVWEQNSGWNAIFNVKSGVVSVTLNPTTDLFDKVLVIMAYSQEGALMYALNIIPAYFTVDQLLLADHVDEVPVMIQTGVPNWLSKLQLDFVYSRSNQYTDFDFDEAINDFAESLNGSGLVSRIDDAGFITLLAGINYDGGVPSLTNLANSAATVQNTYRYILIDGTPENTKAQALGQEVIYNVNRKFESIKVSTGYDAEGKENWKTFIRGENAEWWVEEDRTNARRIKVALTETSNLIGKVIRLGIFVNNNDDEPSYILNVVPAYFTVEGLTLAGQNNDDHDIYLYYGEDPDSPAGVVFDAVFGEYSVNAALSIPSRLAAFRNELQNSKAHLIGRYFDTDLMSGDLRVTVYLDYQNGNPTLVESSAADSTFVIRLDVDFTYTIYGKPAAESEYPPMPTGPRTRTEVQAIGTTSSYTIDLDKTVSMDVEDLSFDEAKLAARGWKVTFEDNVVTVELLPEAAEVLLANDIVLNFYNGYNLLFVLTIQPVLFEVVGVETVYPEQPVNLIGIKESDVEYRAIVKYNDTVNYNGTNVISFVEAFNTSLNAAKGSLVEIENDGQYLKVDFAVDYGTAGSTNRTVPTLLNVANYPLNVIESYIKYTTSEISTSATHYQAVGTTEYYHLGAGFADAIDTIPEINVYNVDGVKQTFSDINEYVTAAVVKYGNSYALQVCLKPQGVLVEDRIDFVIAQGAKTFTMTVKPVWFLVEGFDVVNHPERHMWIIAAGKSPEKISDLSFRVRARYTTSNLLATDIQTRLNTFNQQLADSTAWAKYLETYTIGGEYLVVRAAIEYDENGVANIIDIDQAKPTQIVRDVFKYACYSDKVVGTGIAYPSIPRSRTVDLTIGYDAVYTLDMPNLLTGFTNDMYALYENDDAANADDDSKLKPYTNGSDGWRVEARGNKLYVALDPNADLVNRELKVFVYYNRNNVTNKPDSYDADNVAFILTIHPVWFKVTDFALTGYPNDEIYVDTIDGFMTELTKIDSGKKFVPVFEYSDEILNSNEILAQTENTVGATLQTLMDDFTKEFLYSPYVSKTRTRENPHTYHFQVTTSVAYQAFTGTAILTDETANRIWKTYKIVVKEDANDGVAENELRVEHQAIGTAKTYYLDSSVLDGVTSINNGTNYTITWDQANKNYVTVELSSDVVVNSPIEIAINANYTLKIYPVYYEILGFETVQHPERPVWVISPYSTEDLQYRAITSDLTKLSANDLTNAQADLEAFNAYLNNGAPVSITLDSNQYIVFDAAVNYKADGYPEVVEITNDKRNVVESIIPYRVWSSTQMPKPEHPTVMGSTKANQIIGGTKVYTLKNIKGQAFYQYLWVENAGSLLTPFDKSAEGTTQVYEGISILVDSAKNTMQIQLAADAKYLSNTIRIYIPYLTSVNNKDVWYSHCIEITPLLFELTGWTIEGVGDTGLISDSVYNDYLLLTTYSSPVTIIKYVARINACQTQDDNLKHSIEVAKANLEGMAVDYIQTTVMSNYITLSGFNLQRNVEANDETDTIVGFSSYIVYEGGVPKLVESSKTLISNQILISTGYDEEAWHNKVGKVELGTGVAYAVQAVGTEAVYVAEIPNAAKIFYDRIEVVDQVTQKPIAIRGEQSNLVTVACDVDGEDGSLSAILTVNLAPVIALRDYTVEIRIPYATEDAHATNPNYIYTYYISPVMYIVNGFYLAGTEDNDLGLSDREVALELRVDATYSDDISLRNMVNLLLQSFESSVNNAIRNETLKFEVVNSTGGVNVRLESYADMVWIQKIGDKSAMNYINGAIQIGYSGGMPKLGSVNPLTDEVINVQIQVTTQEGETSYFPGWANVELGNDSQHLQSIGTSRNYPLNVNNMNVVFYYENIEIFNGGLKSDAHGYESFAYEVVNPGRQNLTLAFTLRASARNLNDWIDVRIPYTTFVEGKIVWAYYSLRIKPVLFEIRNWKLKVGDELVDSITLDDSAIELYFSPEIISGPLNQSYYGVDELYYINSAIKRLETEINTYDPKISDGYTYMVINDTPQEGYQVNYTLYRDNSNNTSYLLRDTAEASTTIMQVSANIAYGVTDFSKEYVEGAQAVTGYENEKDARRVTSQISINTTQKSVADSAGDRSTVFITQENAARLMALSSGVDYVLMSDIYLYKITELNNGYWKPVDFPTNATLDGNNYKIFFNSNGFDLSAMPTNIGLFTEIPTGSVVKNLQIVLEHGTPTAPITTLEVNLDNYEQGTVNIGMLAGVNNGIVTNCAVLSQWQFDMQNLTELVNPVTNSNFEDSLPFNKDGYLFDDDYFYEIGLNNDGEPVITNVYNNLGYGVTKNDVTGKWDKVVYDIYMNVANWITPDRTNVARYDDYSAMKFNKKSTIDSQAQARLYVYANSDVITVVLGGLVGSNTRMITNSRVLIDVELYGPEQLTEEGNIDQVNVASSTVGGVVGVNSGTITTTYFRDGSVINNANANSLSNGASLLGGFVGQNTGKIQQSYAMGRSTERENNLNYISVAGAVKTIRNSLGGFVHINSGTITDCLVNMVILKTGTEGAAGGFAYQNTSNGYIANCIENNDIILQSSGTLDYYAPFVVTNNNSKGLSNLIYAGNAESISISDDWGTTLRRLSNNSSAKYADINNYSGFSIGQAQEDEGAWGISPNNTIWVMTDVGPMLRAANDIAISFRKYSWNSSPYLYNPGTAKNPYLIWNKDQFNDYVYAATAQATEADKGAESAPLTNIENSRQNNHLRLVDDVALDGIKDTYKIVYTGTFEGNGLTMSGISLDTVTNDLATMGLFGKTEYATIRNINFEIGNINSTARYVGGIAGIAINTSFVDVSVTGSRVIKGANIVGGFVGLNVVTDSKVENYNLYSAVSVTANFHSQQTDIGAEPFGSGIEYYHQTLYAKVEALDISYEQGFGTAGGVFGFITSNPNNYRVVDEKGNVTIFSRNFEKTIIKQSADGTELGRQFCSSQNSEANWFLKDKAGNVINDRVVNAKGLYYTNQIILRNVSGAIKDVSANVAGGLIGIMDETIELRKPKLNSLSSLTGKYYLGGLVGINLGKISGEVTKNADGTTSTYTAMDLGAKWSVFSSAGSSYVFRNIPSTDTTDPTKRFWGMTVGAVAGFNDGYNNNLNSGVIENINVSVNVLAASSSNLQYIIGGIVGASGDYSYINNAINTHSNLNSYVQVTSSQASNIGFYFGRIVGRSTITTNSFTGTSTTRMNILQINFPSTYGIASYVSATNFATSDYIEGITNAFGIVGDTTLKVQTMTIDEYRDYLLTYIKTRDLVTRMEMLEPWLRSIPTTLSTNTIDGQDVRVEKFAPNGKNELLKWINDNNVFETWDTAHSALKGRAAGNYERYIEYSAISTRPAGNGEDGESENEFVKNIETYRANRRAIAQVLFTYQYNVTTNSQTIAGTQNANFTWTQYENYLVLKQFASAIDMEATEYTNLYRALASKYSTRLADMVYPYALAVEYTAQDGNIRISNNKDFIELVKNMSDSKQYTNQDPLQIYINYVNELDSEDNAFRVNSGWQMSLAQYYYYMTHMYGKTDYKYTDKTSATSVSYTYSVPRDFPATGDKGYVSYLYLNSMMETSSGMLLTVPEFIFMMANEEAVVMKNEEAWVKTGHLASEGGGGARISDIGGITLKWISDPLGWYLVADEVVSENGVISYGDNHWTALENYLSAKISHGLSIAKYKEMIGMGGSLNALLKRTPSWDAVDNYIFELKCEQYHWTSQQVDFIRQYFKRDDGMYDFQYALSATTYGNILSSAGNGNVRAVYQTSAQILDQGQWISDVNSDSKWTTGEPVGVWSFNTTPNAKFLNGDGAIYYTVGSLIELSEDISKDRGAAMYVDIDGNKMFGKAVYSSTGGELSSRSADKDILLLYKVEANEEPDFYSKDESGNVNGYYKIVRQIMPTLNRVVTIADNSQDASANYSDYLEEVLWWRHQGFSAENFDQIKAHAMTQTIPVDSRVLATGGEKPYTYRKTGYTLADDWTADMPEDKGGGKSGFANASVNDPFTTDEYTKIVLGSRFVNGVWNSTYADYLVFLKLYNKDAENTTVIDNATISAGLPVENTPFRKPFPYAARSMEFLEKVTTENELAEAMEFGSDREAFLTLLKSEHTTADYILWAQKYYYKVIKQGTTNVELDKYFRLNHYVYYVSKQLDQDEFFGAADSATDFRWVLDQTVRTDIFYEGVTQGDRTTDLIIYRRDWFNKGGIPFMTYRDYCEWINIYANSDEYLAARGEYEYTNEETGETKTMTSTDGWLTIDAFAVWKRMEKYENNVEYLAKLGNSTAGQDPIVAPIYKRQISTTVFPKIYSSGEQTSDEETGTLIDKNYTLNYYKGTKDYKDHKDNYGDNYYWNMLKYYDWPIPDMTVGEGENQTTKKVDNKNEYDDNCKYPMPEDYQRPYQERFEYNERYNFREVETRYVRLDNVDSIFGQAQTLIQDERFAKACTLYCGGLAEGEMIPKMKEDGKTPEVDANGNPVYENKPTPQKCTDTSHAAYAMIRWAQYVGYQPASDVYDLPSWFANITRKAGFKSAEDTGDKNNTCYYLPLDETKISNVNYSVPYTVGWWFIKWTRHHEYTIKDVPEKKYAQLYIPYDYFEKACKMIKSVYSETNGYAGYFNYMKYWAKNGQADWICNFQEFYDGEGERDGVTEVKKTYLVTNFWNNYDGTKSPVDGASLGDGVYANGWGKEKEKTAA